MSETLLVAARKEEAKKQPFISHCAVALRRDKLDNNNNNMKAEKLIGRPTDRIGANAIAADQINSPSIQFKTNFRHRDDESAKPNQTKDEMASAAALDAQWPGASIGRNIGQP